jgi:hypothetical protein
VVIGGVDERIDEEQRVCVPQGPKRAPLGTP